MNGRGEIAAVIHQYDREKDLFNKVRKKYCQENNFIKNKNINKDKIFYKNDFLFILNLVIFSSIKIIYLFLKMNSKDKNINHNTFIIA